MFLNVEQACNVGNKIQSSGEMSKTEKDYLKKIDLNNPSSAYASISQLNAERSRYLVRIVD